jgi:hypothetical protein
MKNVVKTCGLAAIAAFLMIACIFTSSCKKDKPTQVMVTVIDTSGQKISAATVRVYARPSNGSTNTITRFDDTRLTDGNGQALFDYSSYTKPVQAGFVVLDIEVNKGNELGVGVVRVEEEKRNEKTIVIQ